jgi:hypothetical protein
MPGLSLRHASQLSAHVGHLHPRLAFVRGACARRPGHIGDRSGKLVGGKVAAAGEVAAVARASPTSQLSVESRMKIPESCGGWGDEGRRARHLPLPSP